MTLLLKSPPLCELVHIRELLATIAEPKTREAVQARAAVAASAPGDAAEQDQLVKELLAWKKQRASR